MIEDGSEVKPGAGKGEHTVGIPSTKGACVRFHSKHGDGVDFGWATSLLLRSFCLFAYLATYLYKYDIRLV